MNSIERFISWKLFKAITCVFTYFSLSYEIIDISYLEIFPISHGSILIKALHCQHAEYCGALWVSLVGIYSGSSEISISAIQQRVKSGIKNTDQTDQPWLKSVGPSFCCLAYLTCTWCIKMGTSLGLGWMHSLLRGCMKWTFQRETQLQLNKKN